MFFSEALIAFLISIFGPTFPYQDMFPAQKYNGLESEFRTEKELAIARPLELIDGAYSVKK